MAFAPSYWPTPCCACWSVRVDGTKQKPNKQALQNSTIRPLSALTSRSVFAMHSLRYILALFIFFFLFMCFSNRRSQQAVIPQEGNTQRIMPIASECFHSDLEDPALHMVCSWGSRRAALGLLHTVLSITHLLQRQEGSGQLQPQLQQAHQQILLSGFFGSQCQLLGFVGQVMMMTVS